MAKYTKRKYEEEPEVIKVKTIVKPKEKIYESKPIVKPKSNVDMVKVKQAIESAVIASRIPMGGMVPQYDDSNLANKLKDIIVSAGIKDNAEIIVNAVAKAIEDNTKAGGSGENVIRLLRINMEAF